MKPDAIGDGVVEIIGSALFNFFVFCYLIVLPAEIHFVFFIRVPHILDCIGLSSSDAIIVIQGPTVHEIICKSFNPIFLSWDEIEANKKSLLVSGFSLLGHGVGLDCFVSR